MENSFYLFYSIQTNNIGIVLYIVVFCCLVIYIKKNILSVLNKTRDIRSNILLHLKEFPRANPEATPEGEGVYLTIYFKLSPNTDNVSF